MHAACPMLAVTRAPDVTCTHHVQQLLEEQRLCASASCRLHAVRCQEGARSGMTRRQHIRLAAVMAIMSESKRHWLGVAGNLNTGSWYFAKDSQLVCALAVRVVLQSQNGWIRRRGADVT